MSPIEKITKANSLHYTWGNDCDGWHLVQTETLSVISERMPAGTAEQLHFHHNAQQLFYVLSGEASFTIGDENIIVTVGESLHIMPSVVHGISNLSQSDLEFLVISEPKSHGDREDV